MPSVSRRFCFSKYLATKMDSKIRPYPSSAEDIHKKLFFADAPFLDNSLLLADPVLS